jgi:hypothetical protein
MPNPDKSPAANGSCAHGTEITTAALLQRLRTSPAWPLIFSYEGRDVLPGYHVTEVKSGAFQALDCGANHEAWAETFIQLWDVPGAAGAAWMPAGKFVAIIGKVTDAIALGDKLTFEVSDGVAAMQLYQASAIEERDGAVRVQLSRRIASCKPRDRWLAQQPQQPRRERAGSCCSSAAAA